MTHEGSQPDDEPEPGVMLRPEAIVLGGVLQAGTPVVLLVEDGDHCRVVDGRGLYVEVRRSSLRPLPARDNVQAGGVKRESGAK